MCRTLVESYSGSDAGRIAPPGIPKTTSAPTSSSERTSACAPVMLDSLMPLPLFGRALSCCPAVLVQQKTPRADARRVSASSRSGDLVDTLTDKYELTHG